MTDRIEPTLTAAEFQNEGIDDPSVLGDIRYVEDPRHLAKIIALANDLLPDDDPRKITRERVDTALWCIGRDTVSMAEYDEAKAFLRALESYLPPE